MARQIVNAVCAVALGAVYIAKLSAPCLFLVARWRMLGAGGSIQIWDGIPERGAVSFLEWLEGMAGWVVPYALAGYLVAGLVPSRDKALALLSVLVAAGWAAVSVLRAPASFVPPAASVLALWALVAWSVWSGASLRNWGRGEAWADTCHDLAHTVLVASLFSLFVAEPDSSYGVTHHWTGRLPSATDGPMTYTGWESPGNLFGLGFHDRAVALFVASYVVVGAAVAVLSGPRALVAAPLGVLVARAFSGEWGMPRGGYMGVFWWKLVALGVAGALIGGLAAGVLIPSLWRNRSALCSRMREAWRRFRRLDIDY